MNPGQPTPTGPRPKQVRYPVMVDMRLVPGAISAWLASWLATGVLMPAASQVFAGFLLAGAGMCGWWWWHDPDRQKNPGRHQRTPAGSWRLAVVLSAFLAASGLIVGSLALAHYQADPLVTLAQDQGRHVSVRVVVQAEPVPATSPWTDSTQADAAWVDVKTLSVSAQSGRVSTSVLLFAQGKDLLGVHRGDVVDAIGTIDTSFRGVAPYAGTLKISRATIVARADGWLGSVQTVRQSLRGVVADLPPDSATLITGMAVGDDALMSEQLREAMQTSSLTHLTAVSGTHVAVLLSVIAVIVPGRGPLKGSAVLAAVGGLIAVVGPEPSVIRSALMAMVVVWGMIGRRNGQAAAALAAVATLMLLVDPWCSRSFGFLLSVLATWGVVVPAARAEQWVRRMTEHCYSSRVRTMLRSVAQALIIPICAQMMVQPVMFLLNPWIPTWGVLANVLAAPAVAPTCVFGLGAAASAWVWPSFGHLCAWIACPFAAWIGWVGIFCAGLPLARMPWQIGVLTGLVVLVAALAAWMAVRKCARGVPHLKRPDPFSTR